MLEIVISVIDNGRGFDPSQLPKGHYGLLGMQERAEEIGGTLTVDSSSADGSRVTIAWEDH